MRKQALVFDTHHILEHHVTQHTNDKQKIKPALDNITALPHVLGEAENLLSDTGVNGQLN